MFREIFIRQRNLFDRASRAYANFVLRHCVSAIVFYLLVSAIFILGFINYAYEPEPDALLSVRDGQFQRERERLNRTFPVHSERYFLHKILDLGLAFEVIINAKIPGARYRPTYGDLMKPEFNLLNKSKLDEFNGLFERILALRVEGDYQVDEEGKIGSKNYSYHDICARRLQKCSIEGGIVLKKSVQEKMLRREVTYEINDPVTSYQDAAEVDGFSYNFLFGIYRKDVRVGLNTNLYGDSYATVHAATMRVRFDLDFATAGKKKLATRFLDKFIELMNSTIENDDFKHLNISYFTSHALQKEIEHYSVFDLKFFFTGFILFWLFMAILFNCTNIKASRMSLSDFSVVYKFLVNRAGLFSFVILLQIILTVASSFGTILFLGVKINPLIFEAAIMLMLVASHQCYMLYANTNSLPRRALTKAKRAGRTDQSEPISREEECLSEDIVYTVQRVLVPIVFGFLTIVLAYTVIGLSNRFDAFRINSLFIIICFAFNLFGNMFFYIPFLVLHLRRINADRNCLLGCVRHERDDKPPPVPAKREDSRESQDRDNDITVVDFEPTNTESGSLKSSYEAKDWRDQIFHRLFGTRVKYAILAVFAAYLVVNVVVYAHKYKAEIPVMDVVPRESFIYKHLQNHQNLFRIGPVVMLVLVNPPDVWNRTNYNHTQAMIKELQALDGMDHSFEISWLNEVIINGRTNAQFSPECEDPLNLACFRPTFMGTVANYDMHCDDARFEEGADFKITAMRSYYQLSEFSGKTQQVELMHKIRGLLAKYNYTDEAAFVYSPMFGYLEQLDELDATLIAIFVLFVEAVFIVGLLMTFELRTLFVQTAVLGSLVLAILSNIALINYSLTIITLTHYLVVPAIVCEYFLLATYNYLYPARDSQAAGRGQVNKKLDELTEAIGMLQDEQTAAEAVSASVQTIELSSMSSEAPHRSPPLRRLLRALAPSSTANRLRTRQLRSGYYLATYNSCLVLLFVLAASFLFMVPVDTYGFRTLVLVLLDTFFNIFVHLSIFYPALLSVFGPCWLRSRPPAIHEREPRLIVKL